MRVLSRCLLAVLLLVPVSAEAIDHKNLDEGRPLRLEDAYAIATGEIALEAGAGFTLQRRGTDRGVFPIELLYGALPNVQIGVSTTLVTVPREVDEPTKSGDMRVGALYNLNQETLVIPAFGVKVEAELPTGVESKGVDVEIKGVVTKSIERLSLHFNAAYRFVTDADRDERDGRYELVLGASYPIGAPKFTRATLVGDVFTEQSTHRGESNVVGVELGLRYQLTPSMVWDVGVGTEFAGPSDRSRFFMSTGLSWAF
jgi:outer membrane putative beta-barrel porin/alpha-amylase